MSCAIFVHNANSKRDGIFVRGPDAFFADALPIISGDSEYFHIFHFFEEEQKEIIKSLFSINFAETERPEIIQTFSVSYYFAWVAGSLFCVTGILADVLTRRLDFESGEGPLFEAILAMGLLFDKNKVKTSLPKTSRITKH